MAGRGFGFGRADAADASVRADRAGVERPHDRCVLGSSSLKVKLRAEVGIGEGSFGNSGCACDEYFQFCKPRHGIGYQ